MFEFAAWGPENSWNRLANVLNDCIITDINVALIREIV